MLRFITPENWIKLFIGFALVGVDLVVIFFIGQVTSLDCAREGAQAGCTLTTTWMDYYPLRQVKIIPVNAEVEESCDEEDCVYRLVLRSRTASQPLNAIYSSGIHDKQEKARQINDFLAGNGAETLSIHEGPGWWLLLPVLFLAAGFWMVGLVIYTNYRGQEVDS